MRTTFEHGDRRVTVTKDERRWYVEVAGGLASSRYLDEALETALPGATERERLWLQLKMLQWVYERAGETAVGSLTRGVSEAAQEALGGWPMPTPVVALASPFSPWPMPGPA